MTQNVPSENFQLDSKMVSETTFEIDSTSFLYRISKPRPLSIIWKISTFKRCRFDFDGEISRFSSGLLLVVNLQAVIYQKLNLIWKDIFHCFFLGYFVYSRECFPQ